MEEILRIWLSKTDQPADYYELLGKPQFCDDRDGILQAIHQANRILHGFQNHRDAPVRERARQLQMLLGEADQTFRDDGRWRAYDAARGRKDGAMKRKYATVGIDLGTTFSSIAYVDTHGKPNVVHNTEDHRPIMPSAVFFDGDDIIVGETALTNACVRPESVVQFAKRDIGEPRVYRLGDQQKQYTPETISALVLKKLVTFAEAEIGPIRKVVITVPAFFNEKRRAATEHAGTIAGLEVVATLNEPSAALIAYGLHTSDREGHYVVYDLGGGTFDVTVMRVGKHQIQELATGGNRKLGGCDWDDAILNHVADEFVRKFRSDPRQDPISHQTLLSDCRNAKRQLSERKKTSIRCTHGGNNHIVDLSREVFEQLTRSLLTKTELTIETCLRDAGLDWAGIDGVMLVGGSTCMPMVGEMVRRMSGKEPLKTVNPEIAVALGAAIYAGVLETSGPIVSLKSARTAVDLVEQSDSEGGTTRLGPAATADDLEVVELTLVNSHGIGVFAKKGEESVNVVMIPRNSELPISRTRSFRIVRNNSTELTIKITEGDTEHRGACEVLGTCVLGPLPAGLPAGAPIELQLGYGKDGRVKVSAQCPTTQTTVHAEIQTEGILTEKEVESERKHFARRAVI